MRELTVRAVVAGCLVGGVLGAGNVYMGLKTGWVDSGNFTATLLGFFLLSVWGRRTSSPSTALELNIVQTTAVVIAGVSLAGSLVSSIPALAQLGRAPSPVLVALWSGALGTLGVLLAVPLRARLIAGANLPFPTGIATAELIRSLQAAREKAMARVKGLASSAAVAGALVWVRDGKPSLVPSVLVPPGTLGGTPLGTLTLGLSVAPMLMGAGALVGLRAALSVLLGALIAWAGIAPSLLRTHLVADSSYGAFVGWLVWPGVGLIVGASTAALLRDRSMFSASIREALKAGRTRSASPESKADGLRASTRLLLAVAAMAVVFWVGRALFGATALAMAVSLPLAWLMAGVCARSAGQTDIAPTGAVGQLTQVALAATGVDGGRATINLGGSSVVVGVSGQVATSLWCLRAGEELGASQRAQQLAQLIAVWVGVLVCVPAYEVLARAWQPGSEHLPAPGAAMTRALAEALSAGGSLPPWAAVAALGGLVLGAGLELLRGWRWAPVPLALGVGFVIPASYAAALVLGAAALTLAQRQWPKWAEEQGVVVATGAITGESLVGMAIAIATVAGWL